MDQSLNQVQATARVDMLRDSGQVVGDERLLTMGMALIPTTGTLQKFGRVGGHGSTGQVAQALPGHERARAL